MNKFIALAILLIAIIFIGAPYLTGKVAENQVATVIEQSNQSPLSYGSSEVLSYQRGMFSSASTYRYTMPLAYKTLTNLESFDYQCDMDHGVIGIDYACSISDNPSYRDFVNTYFGGKSPLSMTGNINVFGNISHTIAIDEINNLQFDSSDDSFSLAQSTLTIGTDKDLQDYKISGQSDNFSFNSGSESMSLSSLSLGGDLSQLSSNLFVGDFDMSVGQIELSSPENVVHINNLQVQTSAHENGENLDSTMELSLANMTLPNAQIKSIDAMHFETSVSGLNIEAFSEYQALAREMQSQMFNSDPAQSAAIDPMQMVPIFERMLQKDFNFGFDVSGNLDGKANSFAVNITLMDALTMGDIMSIAMAPDTALGKFDLSINAKLDEGMVTNNINNSLPAFYRNNPILKESGDSYQLDLSINDKVTLNGETMTMQELQVLLLGNSAAQAGYGAQP